MEDSGIPEIIEEGTNPGWKIRIGGSKKAAELLLEASSNGIWFNTEAEMDEYVRHALAPERSEEGTAR